MRTPKEVRSEMSAIKREMKAKGIRRISCFNGGLSGEVYALNVKLFQLSIELETVTKAQLPQPEDDIDLSGRGMDRYGSLD